MIGTPTASLAVLQERARFLQQIRSFFDNRSVMEVDPPVLYSGVATDPFLSAFAVCCGHSPNQDIRYLQTSPEFPMKRLLAQGCGPIYYLGKSFRKAEVGTKHNPEFTMLEWYRPHWDHHQLIEEVFCLFSQLLGVDKIEHHTYEHLFLSKFHINPHVTDVAQLQELALSFGYVSSSSSFELDRDGWLDLLFTHGIEPALTGENFVVVTDYPGSQASLAKTRIIDGPTPYAVAERFEFYYRGMELANGYHELSCAVEQRRRFEEDNAQRKRQGLLELPIDHALLDALANGFPECAGVAVGVDRLLMLKLKEFNIEKVLPFAWQKA